MPIVTILPSGDRVPVKPDETILEGLYNSRYAFRIGCRRGGCAICKVDLREGRVSYNRTVADTVLTAEELASGTCLTCRAVPEDDVTIELRDDSLRMTNAMLRKLRLAAYEKERAQAAYEKERARTPAGLQAPSAPTPGVRRLAHSSTT